MKLHTTEMRMLWWARGKTGLDHVRNVDIWKEAHMHPMAEFLREEVEMVWTCQKRDKYEATRKILDSSRWKAKSRQTKAENNDKFWLEMVLNLILSPFRSTKFQPFVLYIIVLHSSRSSSTLATVSLIPYTSSANNIDMGSLGALQS